MHRLATPRALAYAALVLTAMMWASSVVVARGLLDAMPPVLLTVTRWVAVLAALAPFAWRDREALARAFPREWRSLAVFALIGFAPQTLLFYLGLERTTAINAALLNSTIPVLIVAVAAWLHHRRPRPIEVAGIAISLAGVVVVIVRGRLETLATLSVNPGDLVALASMAIWAYYTVRLADRSPTLRFPSFMFAAGSIGLAIVLPGLAVEAVMRGLPVPSLRSIAGAAYLGLLPTLAAMLLFAYGIRRVGPVQAGLFTHLVPVFAAALAALALGERLQPFHAAGFALVAGGAILGCLRPEAAGAKLAIASEGPTRPR